MSKVSRRKNPDGSIKYKATWPDSDFVPADLRGKPRRNNPRQYFNGDRCPYARWIGPRPHPQKRRWPKIKKREQAKFHAFVWETKIRLWLKRLYYKIRNVRTLPL